MTDRKQNDLDNSLIRASHYGDLDGVVKALKQGANVHARGERAIQAAMLAGHSTVVKLLMQLGARVTMAQVAIGYAQENKIVDGKRLLMLADGGRFGRVAKKVSLKDRQGRSYDARKFADGSTLGLVPDFMGNLHPCVVDDRGIIQE